MVQNNASSKDAMAKTEDSIPPQALPLPDRYRLTVDEIAILAPKQNLIGAGFKGTVALGATIFFVEKIVGRLFPSLIKNIPEKTGAYVLAGGLALGAAIGAHTAIKVNAKTKKFTERLEDAEKRLSSASLESSR